MCDASPRFSSRLPSSAHASALARAFAQGHLCPEHGAEAEPAVMLLTSELVTHALRHGAPPISVALECEITQIRIVVRDGSPGSGRQPVRPEDLSLLIIEKISREWGREDTEGGGTVWCTVPTGVVPPRDPLVT